MYKVSDKIRYSTQIDRYRYIDMCIYGSWYVIMYCTYYNTLLYTILLYFAIHTIHYTLYTTKLTYVCGTEPFHSKTSLSPPICTETRPIPIYSNENQVRVPSNNKHNTKLAQ